MAVLSEIVRNVLVIVLVASFMELMLPEGALRPFVRFAVGLFVLIAVLNPLAGALFSDRDLEIQWWDFQVSPEQQETIMRQGREVNQQISAANQQSLAQKIEGQISAVAMLVPGVDDVETRVGLNKDGSVQSLDLVVVSQPDKPVGDEPGKINVFSGNEDSQEDKDRESIRRKLTSVIHNLYGLEDISVQIEFEGG